MHAYTHRQLPNFLIEIEVNTIGMDNYIYLHLLNPEQKDVTDGNRIGLGTLIRPSKLDNRLQKEKKKRSTGHREMVLISVSITIVEMY